MTPPRGKVRFAVFGAGNITSLRHIPALRGSGRAEILAIIDRHPERAKNAAARFGIPHHGVSPDPDWYDTVQAVTIGVSPDAHFAVARRALEAGKHVLLEKPMTVNLAEARELLEIAKRRERILAVVHNFQFASSAIRLKRHIAAGRLGEITGLFAFQVSTKDRRLPAWHESLPLGLFYDEAPHLLYLLRAFGGDITVQSVTITRSPHGRTTPAVITSHLRAGGVPAVLYNNFEGPVSEWHFIVYGTKAAAAIDVFRDVLVIAPNDGQHLALDVLRTSAFTVGTHLWGVFRSGLRMLRGGLLYGNEEVVRRFLAAIDTGVPPGDISGEDGYAVLRLQHLMIDMAVKDSHEVPVAGA